jgi:hypothetical protein
MEITIFNEKTHHKWPFSIAMVVYQRVKILQNPYDWMDDHLPWEKNDATMMMAHRFFPNGCFSKKTAVWNKM